MGEVWTDFVDSNDPNYAVYSQARVSGAAVETTRGLAIIVGWELQRVTHGSGESFPPVRVTFQLVG